MAETRRVRVLHVITRMIVGGAQENTIASVLGLRQKPDLHVDLLAGPTAGTEGTLEPWVERVPGLLTRMPHLIRPVHLGQDWQAFGDLTRWFRRRR